MLKVAVTGGIGSGKSTASRLLAELGAVVIDSDRLARDVVVAKTPGLTAVAARFGVGVIAGDGSLDRAALAAVVFADADARRDLEAIIHPLVRTRFLELAAAAPLGSIVFNEIPILTDLAVAAQFHLVLGVGADAETRVSRLLDRGLSEPDARARIAAQIDDATRRPLTDVWLDNNGGPDELRGQIAELWTSRLTPFNANLNAGRRAVRGGPEVVAADPSWPINASRLLARIRRAVGEQAVSLDHIGSTAVPGLVAKDVIDLQLGVTSMDIANQLSSVLGQAGFIRTPGLARDEPHPADSDPADWCKVFHANADPGRPVNLHIRVAGGPGWRFALAMRDWLRAEAAAADEYRAVKEALSETFAGDCDTHRYAAAKEVWFAGAWPRLAHWIDSSGWSPEVAP